MSSNERKIWLNGVILNVNDAKVNVLSPSMQFGANVFEGIRCYWNEEKKELYGFRLEDHYKRLEDSLKIFRISCDYSREDFCRYLKDVVKANRYCCDIQVRQTVFIDGFGSWFSKEPYGMFIAPIEKKRKEVPLKEGEKTCISSWERISDKVLSPRAKVGANYINSRLAKLEASDNGYDSALFLSKEGYVAEGTGSCFFMIKDGVLITPSLTDSILDSITRKTILTLAESELDMKVEERHINRTELYTADEAFFCGSAVEIAPIRQIDSYIIGNEQPGKYTVAIHKLYLDVVSGKVDKYRSWLTPIYGW